jgi:phosphomannomutase/phosphoglucomutase
MALAESFSGIRGIYGTELTKDVSLKYAYSYFAEHLEFDSRKTIVIGRDTRQSGKEVFDEIIKVLNCNIIDVGINPTPTIENAVRYFSADGGIIISASHNEPQYNGFKFLNETGAVINPENTEAVIKKFHEIKNKELSVNLTNQNIFYKKRTAIREYKKLLKNLIGDLDFSNYKILADPNGGTGILCREIFKEYNLKARYINMKKGVFKRQIEPNSNSLNNLRLILNKDYEFAAGFDCDADRVELLANNGDFVSGNHILGILAEDFLKKRPKTIVVNNATSYLVKEIAEKYNADFIEVEVGETNVVNKIQESGAVIGGEGSSGGVIIPPEKCRDGILGVLYLLKIMKEKSKDLEGLIRELPEYYYANERIRIEQDYDELKKKIRKHYQEKGFCLSEIGGLKCIDKDGSWIQFRKSKTENGYLAIISDSKNQGRCKQLQEEGKKLACGT